MAYLEMGLQSTYNGRVSALQRVSSQELKRTKRLLTKTSAELNKLKTECTAHREDANSKAEIINDLRAQVSSLKVQRHNDHRRLKRAKEALSRARQKLRIMEKERDRAIHSAAAATQREHETREDAQALLARGDLVRSRLQVRLSRCLKEIRALEKRCERFPQVLAAHVRRARNTPALFRLKTKGVYTPQARALARSLVLNGCSHIRVGLVVRMVGELFGITVDGKMSAHFVRRAVVEGGVASDIQLGYEITQANSQWFTDVH